MLHLDGKKEIEPQITMKVTNPLLTNVDAKQVIKIV